MGKRNYVMILWVMIVISCVPFVITTANIAYFRWEIVCSDYADARNSLEDLIAMKEFLLKRDKNQTQKLSQRQKQWIAEQEVALIKDRAELKEMETTVTSLLSFSFVERFTVSKDYAGLIHLLKIQTWLDLRKAIIEATRESR